MFASVYTVRYRLSGGSGEPITRNVSGTRATLQGLVPNGQYVVQVATINSNGVISEFSAISNFTVTPAAAQPSEILHLSHQHAVFVHYVALYQAVKVCKLC